MLANDIEFVNGSYLKKSNRMSGDRYRSFGRWITVCLFVLLSGCASYKEGGSRTVGEFTDDVGIQAAVKTALLRDKEISGFSINVEVSRSVVTLYGRIPSDYARQKALQIAADVRGVASVQDRLTLVEE